jgi:hypothetical protein
MPTMFPDEDFTQGSCDGGRALAVQSGNRAPGGKTRPHPPTPGLASVLGAEPCGLVV